MAGTQLVHDRVNLLRLVTRLENEVERRQTWGSAGISAWVKASTVAKNLGYARRLLRSVQIHEIDSSTPSTSSNILPDLEKTLDRLEPIVLETQKSLAPQQPLRKSLLSDLPRPTPPPKPTEPVPPPHEQDVKSEPKPEPKPNQQPPAGQTTTHVAVSLKTQEELSAQLADMAKQLKLNSIHFAEALVRDKAVMEGAEEKLQGNLTRMQAERGRLNVHSSKSGSTTWIVIAAIVTVIVAWIVMFLIIRIT